MGPAPPERRKPIAQSKSMGKFAFVDSNNYCVAEIDKEGGNPLVSGKLAHVDAKHFTTSAAKQSKVSLRAALHDVVTDEDALPLELPDVSSPTLSNPATMNGPVLFSTPTPFTSPAAMF